MSLLCHIIDKLFHRVQISAYLYKSLNSPDNIMRINNNEPMALCLLCLSIVLLIGIPPTYSGFASAQNNTSMQPDGIQGESTNATNVVLVHGTAVDGSFWNKVIPILQNAGHKVIAAQLPLHSLADDVDTVKRAIGLIGGPVTLVGHSYGGFVISNAAYDNPNVTGLVYLSAFAPNEGQSLSDFVDPTKLPKGFSLLDSGGFIYVNPEMFAQVLAQDIDPAEVKVLAAAQKPYNQSVSTEKSGTPAWKQLPTWYGVSENDRIVPPDAQRMFAEQINATVLSINSSHASPLSHPNEVAQLILNATQGSNE
jgi:pimeloyl-ACP methyl ester carboxylesterase